MNENKSNITRRSFFSCASLLAIGGSLVGFKHIPEWPKPKLNSEIWKDFTEEEKELIAQSTMAQEIITYPPLGYNCAESLLIVSLKHLGKSEEIANIAAGFGGGIGHYDLCGLFTAGFMAIGISAGMIYTDHKEISSYVKNLSREYWNWWEERAPRHCHDLKPRYSWKSDNYHKMIQRVALKVEELINPALNMEQGEGDSKEEAGNRQ